MIGLANVGAMRERVTIYSQSQTTNAAGEITTTWATGGGGTSNDLQWGAGNTLQWGGSDLIWGASGGGGSVVWARIEPLGAKQIVLANRDDAQRLYKMTVRYTTQIHTNSRIVWRGRNFDVEGVIDETEQRQFLTVNMREINA